MRRRCPESIPAGNVTFTFFDFGTTPSALHVLHGVLMTAPRPPQRAHGAVNMTKPRALDTCPVPRHAEHASGLVPGAAPAPPHVSQRAGTCTEISLLQPNAASSSVSRA